MIIADFMSQFNTESRLQNMKEFNYQYPVKVYFGNGAAKTSLDA